MVSNSNWKSFKKQGRKKAKNALAHRQKRGRHLYHDRLGGAFSRVGLLDSKTNIMRNRPRNRGRDERKPFSQKLPPAAHKSSQTKRASVLREEKREKKASFIKTGSESRPKEVNEGGGGG